MTPITATAVAIVAHGPARDGWAEDAACADEPKSSFFLPAKIGYGARVRAMCAGCPVRLECLSETLRISNADDHGFRGGLTPRERALLRRAVPLVRSGRAS